MGDVIVEARRARNMTQMELASLVGITRGYMCDIEKGRRVPSVDHTIKKFAEVLGINNDYLHYLANSFPKDIREADLSEEDIKRLMSVLRSND